MHACNEEIGFEVRKHNLREMSFFVQTLSKLLLYVVAAISVSR